jgi:hypothetical protein
MNNKILDFLDLSWKNLKIENITENINNLNVDNIGPIPLFNSSDSGYISILLVDSTITNINSIEKKDFYFDEGNKSVTFRTYFPVLKFSGNYKLDNNNIFGCSIRPSHGLLSLFSGNLLAEDPVEENLALARQYRDELKTSENGTKLVEVYDSNNEIINSIISEDFKSVNGVKNENSGTFKLALLEEKTNGKNTSDFTTQVSMAAKNPDDSSGLDDRDFQKHSFFLQAVLAMEADSLIELNEPHGEKLFEEIQKFEGYTSGYLSNKPANVSSIMNEIKTTNIDQPSGAIATFFISDEVIYMKNEAEVKAKDFVKDFKEKQYSSDSVDSKFSIQALQSINNSTFTGEIKELELEIKANLIDHVDILEINIQSIQLIEPVINITFQETDSGRYPDINQEISNIQILQKLLIQKIKKSIKSSSFIEDFSSNFNTLLKSNI